MPEWEYTPGIKGDENDETFINVCFNLTPLFILLLFSRKPSGPLLDGLFRNHYALVWETRTSSLSPWTFI